MIILISYLTKKGCTIAILGGVRVHKKKESYDQEYKPIWPKKGYTYVKVGGVRV